MTAGWAAVAQVGIVVALVLVAQWPLGGYLARVLADGQDNRVERGVYRVVGVDPRGGQTWSAYAVSVLVFSLLGVLVLYTLLRLQRHLPWSLGREGMPAAGAFNTATSFVTNTNWQSYSGDSALGYVAQMAGLTVQNFLSAAVGIAVAFVIMRGFAGSRGTQVGNFWVDVTRIVVRVLLPLSMVLALVLLLGGVIQNLNDPLQVTNLAGSAQTIPGGPVATQEAIKQLGTNGGGFFNANSAHPFENPSAWTNTLAIVALLVIPFSLPRALGITLGNRRQGTAILAAMGILWLGSVAVATWSELSAFGAAGQLAGGAMEGKEVRFGEAASALFAASTTATSTGAVNASHDSLTAPGGGIALTNMMLGEVSPGGVGSGLYGILVMAVMTVFLAGLMVGRTPELCGKRISQPQVSLAALYLLTTPVLLLVGAAITVAVPELREASITQDGPHGLTSALYAYASAANNNGSAFGSFNAATDYQNTVLGVLMVLGRFVPMILVIALAGSLIRQPRTEPGPGTLRTDTPLFVALVVVVVLFLAGLTYVPALALAPLAEAL